MAEPTPEELLEMVRAEYARVYGARFAGMCFLEYARGWYYFSEPTIGEKGELKGNPLGKPMQRKQMLKLLESLREMQPKKRKL